jgi:hypothetical protein
MVATAIHGEQVLAREKNMVSANFSPRTRRPRWPHSAIGRRYSAKSRSAADGIGRAFYRDEERRWEGSLKADPKG